MSEDGKIYGGGVMLAARAVTQVLFRCQAYLDIRGDIAEIGVLEGEYLRRLCDHVRPGETVLAIDPYIEFPELAGRLAENLRTRFPDGEGYKFLQQSSKDLTPSDIQPDGAPGVRFFSIDGDHTAAFVAHDLYLAHQTLTDGGIIALDDYFDSNCPGVSIGTTQFFLEHNDGRLAVLLYAGNKVFITTAGHHQIYRTLLEKFTDIRDHLAHGDVNWFGYPAFVVGGQISDSLPG